jgi:hypothetical protein
MPHDEDSTWNVDASAGQPPAGLRLRLDFRTVFRRVALLVLLVLEIYAWFALKWNFPFAKRKKRIMRLLYLTPRMSVGALLVGGAVAILADLTVRLLVQPLARAWFTPPVDLASGSFHMASNERVEQAVPARRASRRRWRPGVLVRTNLRVWFFPSSWDDEPWSVHLEHLAALETRPAPPLARGIVAGLPDRVVIQATSGDEATFAVAEPAVVLAWRP